MTQDPIARAVANRARPETDRARDGARNPAAMLSFAGVTPGMKVAEWIPDGGYFTRMISDIVGPVGKVYGVEITEWDTGATGKMAAEQGHENVSVLFGAFGEFSPPELVDLVWTSLNYHDLHVAEYGAQAAEFNARVHGSLKPDGAYLVFDHQAAPETNDGRIADLHRIEKSVAIAEIEAAGFVLARESDLFNNPSDDRLMKSSDPAIRGHTDRFLLLFRKVERASA